MTVTEQEIRAALRTQRLSGQAVCVHSSLRSFGHVDGGAHAVVMAFLGEGCTLLVPTFTSAFEVAPPAHLRCHDAVAGGPILPDAGEGQAP